MSSMGWMLIVVGLIIAGLGGILLLSGKVPWLGQLPGDIHIQGDNYTVYFPITTCILLSVVLSLLLYLFGS